jgi:hypothetical protein
MIVLHHHSISLNWLFNVSPHKPNITAALHISNITAVAPNNPHVL